MSGRRLILLILLGLVLLLSGLLVVARQWAARRATRDVRAVLVGLNGGPVEFDRVRLDLGLSGISVERLRFHERGDRKRIWLTVVSGHADLVPWKLPRGIQRPRRIVLRGALVRLRFDGAGRLRTRLPKLKDRVDLPGDLIVLEEARVAIEQEGRAPLRAEQIDLRVRQVGHNIEVAGKIGSLLGTRWAADVKVHRTTHRTDIQLAAAPSPFTLRQVAGLPFVPAGLPPSVQVEGISSVALRATVQPKQAPRYRLELDARALRFALPVRNFALQDGAGLIVLEDGVATTNGLTGTVADGRFTLDARIDLAASPVRAELSGRLDDVRLARLPAGWFALDQVDGSLSGTVELASGGPGRRSGFRGTASGTLDDVTIRDLRLPSIGLQFQLGPAAAPPGAPAEGDAAQQNQLQIDLAADKVELQGLRRLWASAGRDLRLPLTGQLSVQASVVVPLRSANDPARYHGRMTVSTESLAVAGVAMRQFQATATYRDGLLSIRRLRGQFQDGGRLAGRLDARLVPAGDLKAWIECEQIPLAGVARHLARPAAGWEGLFSVSGEAQVPVDRWDEPGAWRARGRIGSRRVTALGYIATNLRAQLALAQGRLSVTGLRGVMAGGQWCGEASFGTTAPYRFDAQLDVRRLELTPIVAGLVELQEGVNLVGKVDAAGRLEGTLAPLAWQARGEGSLEELALSDRALGPATFAWQANDRRWQLTDISATWFGGQVQGQASGSWTDARSAEGRFDQVDATAFFEWLRAHYGWPADSRWQVDGPVSGEFTAAAGGGDEATVEVRFRGLRGSIQKVPFDDLHGTGSYAGGGLRVRLEGATLGGRLALRAATVRPADDPAAARIDGQLRLTDVDLARGWRQFRLPPRSGRPRGRLGGRFDFSLTGPPWQLEGRGQASLQQVRWRGGELVRQASAGLKLDNDVLQIHDIDARLAGGRLKGTLAVPLGSGKSGSVDVVLRRARGRRLLALWPSLGGMVDGLVDLRLQGRLGHEWAGRGQLRLAQARLARVPVHNVLAPIEWTISPARGAVRIVTRGATAHVAGGRVRAALEVAWRERLSLRGQAQFAAVDVRSLARAAQTGGAAINGRLSGRITLDGRNVRSFDDLTGTVRATLTNSQALSLPLFDSLVDAVLVGQLLSPGAGTASLEGRLARGTLRIDRLLVEGTALQLLIDGTVARRGRLDLNATVDTGMVSVHLVALRMLANPLGFLGRRLIFLHVGGTIQDPVIGWRPMDQLQNELAISIFR